MSKLLTFSVVLFLISLQSARSLAQEVSWTADCDVVAQATKRLPDFNFSEAKVPGFDLPPVLAGPDGVQATSVDQWTSRLRSSLIDVFRSQVYGHRPEQDSTVKVEVVQTLTEAFGGKATGHQLAFHVLLGDQTYTFPVVLFVPQKPKVVATEETEETAETDVKVPAVIFINNRSSISLEQAAEETDTYWPARQIIDRGYATASFHTSDIDPDDEQRYAEGVRSFLAQGQAPADDTWGSLSAWGWTASRVLDHLQSIAGIDAQKVSVVGHSRGGKTALWAAAEDQRFAIAYSNNSGCGGAAISRRRLGETVGRITERFPHWFCKNFAGYADREDNLPVDQHQLIALIAPRSVYVTSAADDLWADPRGEYLAILEAHPAFELLGQDSIDQRDMPPLNQPRHRGATGYHIRDGQHGLLPSDWAHFLDFADSRLGG